MRSFLTLASFLVACSGGAAPYPFADATAETAPDARGTEDSATAIDALSNETADAASESAVAEQRTYFASCLPAATGDNASQSFLFYVDATFAADGKSLDLEMTPLRETATNFALSQTVGDAFRQKAIPIVDGRFVFEPGDVGIPGDAQRFGPSTIVFRNLRFEAQRLDRDGFCAEMKGEMTSPIPIDLSPPGDGCVFRRLDPGSPLPTATEGGATFVGFVAAEHRCP
jgi:hypothetical protein